MSPLQRQFDQQWLSYRSEPRILIACSGGPDSVALLRLLLGAASHSNGLCVAHFNHRLRGPSADADARFVAQLCRQTDVGCEIGHADPDAIQATSGGEGLESAARRVRYRFLVRTAERLGIRYLVTGHTADDHVETVLHHILRGTGLAGLAGVSAVRRLSPAVTLLRPMLRFHREEILAYLKETQQEYCLDEHNEQYRFVRSRIRHELLPLLEQQYYPAVRDSLTKLAKIAADAHAYVRGRAEVLLEDCTLATDSDEWQLDCDAMRVEVDHLRREAFVCLWQQRAWPLQSMTFDHWQRLAHMTDAVPAEWTADLPGAVHVRRTGSRLILTRK